MAVLVSIKELGLSWNFLKDRKKAQDGIIGPGQQIIGLFCKFFFNQKQAIFIWDKRLIDLFMDDGVPLHVEMTMTAPFAFLQAT